MEKMQRIKVTGLYTTPRDYVLLKEDGTEFLKITEFHPFLLGGVEYIPVRVPNIRGYGTVLKCERKDENGKSHFFVLPHEKELLWALTPEAAEQQPFIFFHKSDQKSPVVKAMQEAHIPMAVLQFVPAIDKQMKVGGVLCNHVINRWGYVAITDAIKTALSEPRYVGNNHAISEHRGCMNSTYRVHYAGGTYLVYYVLRTSMDGVEHRDIRKILLTPQANQEEVANILQKFAKGTEPAPTPI